MRKEIGITEAGRRCGASRQVVEAWVQNYEAEGVYAFLPRKNKAYSPELKEAAVKSYLAGEGSLAEISQKYQIRDKRQLINWLKVYNGGGDLGSVKHSGGGSYMKQGRDTTQAERIEIAKACLAWGKNYGEVAIFQTFDEAVEDNPNAHPLFHSDRGFQYINRIFRAKLEAAGMTQSMSRVAHCIDNGSTESFWGILKRERYYGRRFTGKEELMNMIPNYIAYYNNRRAQRNLGVLTPAEKHEQYFMAA